jgi:hypothetical protein
MGSVVSEGKAYFAAYLWNGIEMIQKWSGSPDISNVFIGNIYITPKVKKDVALLMGSNNSFFYCEDGRFDIKGIPTISMPHPDFRFGNSSIGITKKKSFGELWTIQAPASEGSLYNTLYMAQYTSVGFLPLSKVNIKGINTDRISTINIVDIDNDGVGEIVGSEVAGTTMMPVSGEEAELKYERSYLFAAKWTGSKYEVLWRRWAADRTIQEIALADVTGDGQKEIIASGYSIEKNKFALYVFRMPKIKE